MDEADRRRLSRLIGSGSRLIRDCLSDGCLYNCVKVVRKPDWGRGGSQAVLGWRGRLGVWRGSSFSGAAENEAEARYEGGEEEGADGAKDEGCGANGDERMR